MPHNVPAVTDARECQRAGVPQGEPPQAAKRQPACYLSARPAYFRSSTVRSASFMMRLRSPRPRSLPYGWER